MKRRSFLAAIFAAPVAAVAMRLPRATDSAAVDYYTWADAVGRDLYRAEVRAYGEQLRAITGGMGVERFIAAKQAEAVATLKQIDARMRVVLASR